MTSELKAFQVVIIGTGNVATVLGQRLFNAGVSILQVVGRSEAAAKQLATQLHCSYSVNWNDIKPGASLYLVAVSDSAIAQLLPIDVLKEALVAHTAGSVSIQALSNLTSRPAIFYPLQSLRSSLTNSETVIPILIDALHADDFQLLKEIASLISQQVAKTNDADRMYFHVGAVIVNNFTNHLYKKAEQFCADKEIDFKLLQPLMEETVNRLKIYKPEAVQTGPAIRGDVATIAKHQALLNDQPDLLALYQIFSEQLVADCKATSKGK